MRILHTPPELRSPPIPYPPHSIGMTMEQAAYQHLIRNQNKIDTPLVYLPIFWQSNYWADKRRKRTADVGAVPEAQRFLDTQLDKNETYFTVSQADEGAYERLPPNLLVFSGGGVGHIALPLLCDDHPAVQRDRTLLASFLGTVETGGPAIDRLKEPLTPRPGRSSWDVNGAGATVRRAVMQAFGRRGDCHLSPSIGGVAGRQKFIELACSSKFALCPRGYGQASFRMYEAMKLGAVPVYIYDDCWLPYADVLDWSRLGVLCHVKDLPGLPDRLAAVTDWQLDNHRQYLAQSIPDFFTLAGACRQIVRYIENIPATKATV